MLLAYGKPERCLEKNGRRWERQDGAGGINIPLVQLGPTPEQGQAGLGNQIKIRLTFRRGLPAAEHPFTMFVRCIFLLVMA